MKIRKIYACWVYVSDMAQSVRFYQDIGFTVKFVEKDGAWVEFDLGETSFALLQRPEEKGKVQPRKTRIMFEVARIEEMQEHLISLTFEDPDGHWLEFFEPHPPKPKTQYPTPNT